MGSCSAPSAAAAAAEAAAGEEQTHIVLVSFQGKGHLNPFILLAEELAQLGVTITLACTDAAALDAVTKLHPRIHLRSLSSSRSSGSSSGSNSGSSNSSTTPPPERRIATRIRQQLSSSVAFPTFAEELRELLKSADPHPVSAVVLDLLLPWAIEPVDELRLPRYVLYTAPLLYLSLSLHILRPGVVPQLFSHGSIAVPGLASPLQLREVPRDLYFDQEDFYLSPQLREQQLLRCCGILANTCLPLEHKVLNLLESSHPELNVIPVGMLARDAGEVLPSAHNDRCKSWLDARQERSVVYLCFGSWTALPEDQMSELALGLEASGVSFLWVLHSADALRSLPDGFVARTSARGLVLSSWAPQWQILRHAAIGAFVTHAGWNSVTECVRLAGVPMLAWPFLADQPLIARYVCDELGVALAIEDVDGVADRHEVERKLRALVSDVGLRSRAQELRARVLGAPPCTNPGLQDFVRSVKQVRT